MTPPDKSEQFKNSGLTPFQPGKSGNPHGRPEGRKESLRAQLRRKLRLNPSLGVLDALKGMGVDLRDASTAAEGLAEVLLIQAAKGDVQAMRLIASHTERPLKTDQPEVAQVTNNTQVMIYIPDNGRDRAQVAGPGAVALPVLDDVARPVAPAGDTLAK